MGEKTPTVIRDASGQVDFSESDLTGATLSGRYRVEEKLGEGAMGAVFRAEHELMKKTVAIKVLRPNMNDQSEIVARFRREAQAAAHIDHPNICAATDFGQMPDGTFFLVIEYLEGRTLEEALDAQGRLPVEQVLHIAAQMADALEQAHKAGVVHRDLKPENVMLVYRDEDPDFVKIMDFGVAHVRLDEEHETERLTRAGFVYGTPSYMSPEQASGGEVDPRADIYSLGIICYELLTGDVPFRDENVARIMAMHVTEEPVPPSELAPDAGIPPEVEQLVLDMLAKDPVDRPSSAAQVKRRIDDIREDEQPESNVDLGARGRDAVDRMASGASGGIDRARAWMREQDSLTRTVVVLAAMTLALALLVVPTAIFVSVVGGDSAEQRAERERDLAAEREAFIEKDASDELREALDSKRAGQIVKAAEGMLEKSPDNAHLHYLKGVYSADLGRWDDALGAYERALAADSAYRNDGALIEDVFARFSSRNAEDSQRAADIIREDLGTGVSSRRLADIARTSSRKKTRKRAVTLLQRTGGFGELEDWNEAAIRLRDAKGCDEHRKYIEEIASAGDPRALETLEIVQREHRRGCGFMGLQRCLSCVKDDLKEAISTLEAARAEQGDEGK
ncbi:MAG: protein kinase domain-containing protein [Myxococcota bacterium]